jgi:hypothetical protein
MDQRWRKRLRGGASKLFAFLEPSLKSLRRPTASGRGDHVTVSDDRQISLQLGDDGTLIGWS